MGGSIKTGGQIYAISIQHLMPAILPQETAGYVIYFALAGYEGRYPILAIVLASSFFINRCISKIPWVLTWGVIDKGETLCKQDLPDTDSNSTA